MSARSSSSLAPAAAVRTMNPPRAIFALALDDVLQPLPLFLGRDLARHAGMVHGRHEYQKASRQRDVAGDARALLADRFLGNLDQNFLPFFQQFADLRDDLILAAAETPALPAASSAAPLTVGIAAALKTAALRALQQPCLGRRSPHFGAGIDCAIANRLGLKQCLGFRLRLFQFKFFCLALLGFQNRLGNLAILAASAGSAAADRLSYSGRQQLSAGRARFLFHFLEAVVVARLFAVGRDRLLLLRSPAPQRGPAARA